MKRLKSGEYFKLRLILVIFVIVFLYVSPRIAKAGDFVEDTQSSSSPEGSDSNFDPFSDYTEFEEGSEEESDVNFFHNGRFFTVGLQAGYQSFTDILGKLYKPTFDYGVFVSYFFDLKFSVQVAYLTADHSIDILDGRTQTEYQGKATISHFEFDAKYYLNTQNVTKGLASLNPYLLIGFSQYYRTQTIVGQQGYARDTAFGFQGGAGIEIPMLKNRMFFGVQGLYNYISFPDRGAPLVIGNTPTNIYMNGDAITVNGILGFNF